MNIPTRELGDLIDESQDLQSDGRRSFRGMVPQLRDLGRRRRGRPVDQDAVRLYAEQRRTILRRGGMGMGALAAKGLVGTGFGTAVTTIVARPVSAQEDVDIQILQTAASLENLAVHLAQVHQALELLVG